MRLLIGRQVGREGVAAHDGVKVTPRDLPWGCEWINAIDHDGVAAVEDPEGVGTRGQRQRGKLLDELHDDDGGGDDDDDDDKIFGASALQRLIKERLRREELDDQSYGRVEVGKRGFDVMLYTEYYYDYGISGCATRGTVPAPECCASD